MAEAIVCPACAAAQRVAAAYEALLAEAEARGLTRSVPWPVPVAPRPRRVRTGKRQRAPWWERARVRMLYPVIG